MTHLEAPLPPIFEVVVVVSPKMSQLLEDAVEEKGAYNH